MGERWHDCLLVAAARQCYRRWFVIIYCDDFVIDASSPGGTKSDTWDVVDELVNSEGGVTWLCCLSFRNSLLFFKFYVKNAK
tara:strand:+ start:70 stop:315 length:246 start_codon:yes stop_codon:yes gene_type:complete